MPQSEISHFSGHIESFSALSDYINYGKEPADRTARLEVLRQHGLLFPTDEAFSYTCTLASHAYEISGRKPQHQSQGMCGGDPRISLSLKRGDAPIFIDVFAEPSCFARRRPTSKATDFFVKSFFVDEGPFGNGSLFAVISDGKRENALSLNEQPLTQQRLGCLGERGFFDPETENAAEQECFDKNQKEETKGK